MLIKFNVHRSIKLTLLLVFMISLICNSFPTSTSAETPACTSSFTTQPMVSAGDNHSVFLKSDGTVWAWGQNNFGQLGNGLTTDSSPSVQVKGLCDVIAISAGPANSVALKSDGTVWAWGQNNFGQLGNGTTSSSSIPVQVSNISDVAAIAAGAFYTVALKKDGTVWTWGYNATGQLGYDTLGSNHSKVPQQVSALTGIKSISAGFNHAAAVSSTGAVWTWGDNASSQLGRATSPNSFSSIPAQVTGLGEAQSISLGLNFSTVLLKDGTVWSWGYNGAGQLGNGTRIPSLSPVQVLYSSSPLQELNNVMSIEAGYEHTIALLSDGSLQAWGSNTGGQIGDADVGGWRLFATKSNLSGTAVSVSAGRAHSVAGKSDGTVWTWGENSQFQLGRTTPFQGSSYAPSNVPGQVIEGLVDCNMKTSYRTKPMVAAGYQHSVALKSDGTVWTWGSNDYGQLGNGKYGDNVAPAQVPSLCYITAIAAGTDFTIALKSDGTVWAWGDNANGQLGNGTSGIGNRSPIPVQAAELSGVIAIAAGKDYSMALKKDGTVWTWGMGDYGQLGYAPPEGKISSKPKQISSLSKVKAIAAQFTHATALKTDGTIWTWGDNTSKALGYDTSTPSLNPAPRQVPNLSNIASIATGAGPNTVVLKNDGTVWDWGGNMFSQLGNGKKGIVNSSAIPVRVIKANNNGLENVAAVSAGYSFSLALLKNGTLWGWGFNANGQLGNGTYEYEEPFAQRLLMNSIVSVSGGYAHTLVIKKDGTVWSWGNNNHYQLGRKSGAPDIPNTVPGPVEGLGQIESLSIIPFIPINIGFEGTVGSLTDDTPIALRGAPITISAFFDDPQAVKVTLIATDADGQKYEAQMSTTDGENWSHTFEPKQVGLWASPLTIEIIPQFANNVIGTPIAIGIILIDPSGIVYNAKQGDPEVWPLPGATVMLQYYDPVLGDEGQWVDMNENDYPDLFKPTANPQITGEDGRYAWDTAPGQYRVVVSRPGFETSASDIVTVPPPVLDLHVGLIPTDHLEPSLSVTGVTYGETYTQPVNIEWYASDDHADNESVDDASGVRFVQYQLNDGEMIKVNGSSGSFIVDAPGSHIVHFTAVDHAGNEYTESIPFEITEPPVGEVSYTVTFNSNGGSPTGSLTVKEGSTATKPTAPYRIGYTFAGWYLDSEWTTAFDFTTAITRDLVLYAKWTVNNSTYIPNPPVSNTARLTILVDGEELEHIAEAATSREGEKTVITVKLDAAKLMEQLAKAKDKATVVIPVTASSDEVTLRITGDTVKALERKQAVLEMRTPNGNYRVPAAEIHIDSLSQQLGERVSLSDIIVHVDIAKSNSATVKLLENAAVKARFTVLAPSVDFQVTAFLGDNKVSAHQFNSYVRREIPVPKDVDPNKMTTAVVLEADGTIHHVPTYIEWRDGKYYAIIHSLTNSTYALIEHSITFMDVKGHWAEEIVNDLGARTVISGVDATHYQPNNAITRAEFATIIVQALGLAANETAASFADVKSGDWYAGAVAKAHEYGIIAGYEDGTFRLMETITRQEAITVIARAMKLAGLETNISASEADVWLSPFTDSMEIGKWARQAIAATVKNGIVTGSYSRILPTSNMTRAEVARIVQQLLIRAQLIDSNQTK